MIKSLNQLIGERVIVFFNGQAVAHGVVIPPRTEFIDCAGELISSDEYVVRFDEAYAHRTACCISLQMLFNEMEGQVDGEDTVVSIELEPLQVKLQRESAKPPVRTGGEKSCWYDMFVSSIEVGFIDNGKFIGSSPEVNSGSVEYHTDDVVKAKFGFALNLPDGKEAHILPRSGTFKKYNLLLTNSQGVIDTQYRGDGDEWASFWYAMDDGTLTVGDRIAQFKIDEVQPHYDIEVVDKLNNADRGGFGSTGRN